MDTSVDVPVYDIDGGECGRLTRFIAAGKPVFHVEYELKPAQFCSRVRASGFGSMAEHLELDAWRAAC